ncbi:MAG: methyltransferase domain-containing protein [Proteobacteria bacterium]|nr:methyltransferase domain-containing protein [Pseudomonadota bacterium]
MPEATLDDILTKSKGFMESQLILSAHELGIFDVIGKDSFTSDKLSEKTDLNKRGLRILLDGLAAIGLLEKSGRNYANTGTGLRHLVSGGADCRSATLDHIIRMREAWLRLHESVKSGTTARREEESLVHNRERNRSFILAMRDIGQANAKTIAENLDLSRYKSLIDLGGGPGSFSMEIIKKFPHIRATVVDLPLTLEVASEVIKEAGMADKVALREADFFNDPESGLGKGYDLAVISNVLHIEGVEQNKALLKRLYSAMDTSGMLIIHETIIDETRTAPADRALFAINMLVNTERGNAYTFDEMRSWLEEAGFSDVTFIDCFDRPSLMVAYKR